MKKLFTMLLGLLFAGVTMSQSTRQVTGKVIGNDNAPVASATVQVKGGTQSAMTGNDGSFSITVPSGQVVLSISSSGFLATEVTVTSGQSSVNVTLNADNKQLNEVVVTAMGLSKNKRTLSYATQQVGVSTISKARELNVANSLIGRVAGLDVARSSSGVGGSSRVVLRGDRSITGNNQALIVIDGVPMDNSISVLVTQTVVVMVVMVFPASIQTILNPSTYCAVPRQLPYMVQELRMVR